MVLMQIIGFLLQAIAILPMIYFHRANFEMSERKK
jgi:hypothetical protein